MTNLRFNRQVSRNLLNWWKKNQRRFPWRNTRELYPVLISEVLLHRTKAEQVATIYPLFLKKYPTIRILAKSNLDDLIETLHSLGLHWRTELLHKMAIEIVEKYQGNIPTEKEELMSLLGVGEYIASAVRCFSLGYVETILDTNTVRIVGRLTGLKTTEGSRRNKHFKHFYSELIDASEPREFNYAMLDLGALVCKPKDPLCELCPIKNVCSSANLIENGKNHPQNS